MWRILNHRICGSDSMHLDFNIVSYSLLQYEYILRNACFTWDDVAGSDNRRDLPKIRNEDIILIEWNICWDKVKICASQNDDDFTLGGIIYCVWFCSYWHVCYCYWRQIDPIVFQQRRDRLEHVSLPFFQWLSTNLNQRN